MAYKAPKPVQAPDDQHVTGAYVVEQRIELGAFVQRAERGIVEHTGAVSCRERVELQAGVLLADTDPGVADQVMSHTQTVAQTTHSATGETPILGMNYATASLLLAALGP